MDATVLAIFGGGRDAIGRFGSRPGSFKVDALCNEKIGEAM